MAGTLTLDKKMLKRRFDGVPEAGEAPRARRPDHVYNIVLSCGNLVQIFTPDRFHELPKEVDRLLGWGNNLSDIDVALLEADDPFA